MKAYRKEIFKSRFQEHYPRLCCIACGYVSDKEDAEDIVQELFISVWNKGLDEMEEKEFAAYMTTAVKNSCISFLRKRKDDVVSIEDYHQPASCLTDDEEDADGKSPEELLESVLAVLPPRCRDIFLMAKLQGMKYREIAESLNLSEKTIENQMTKAIKMLREYVATYGVALTAVVVIILSMIVNCE